MAPAGFAGALDRTDELDPRRFHRGSGRIDVGDPERDHRPGGEERVELFLGTESLRRATVANDARSRTQEISLASLLIGLRVPLVKLRGPTAGSGQERVKSIGKEYTLHVLQRTQRSVVP